MYSQEYIEQKLETVPPHERGIWVSELNKLKSFQVRKEKMDKLYKSISDAQRLRNKELVAPPKEEIEPVVEEATESEVPVYDVEHVEECVECEIVKTKRRGRKKKGAE